MSAPALRDARVLVTGATGFIGGRLVTRLVAEGAVVHATLHRRPLPRARAGPTVEAHTTDLADPAATSRLIERVRPDIIVHLASHVAGSRDQALVLPTLRASLMSSVSLLDAASRARCRRFVQIGSLEEPADEDTAGCVPSSPYAAAKWAAALYGRMFHALYGTPVVLARLFMVYGPGQWDTRKLVPYTILSLARGEMPRFTSGSRAVDWVYVDDVVEGLIRLATAPRLDGARVDLGSGQQHTVRAVVEAIFEQMAPAQTPTFGGRRDRAMEQVRLADVAQTERLIGWRPVTALPSGLAKTIAWYREAHAQGLLAEDRAPCH